MKIYITVNSKEDLEDKPLNIDGLYIITRDGNDYYLDWDKKFDYYKDNNVYCFGGESINIDGRRLSDEIFLEIIKDIDLISYLNVSFVNKKDYNNFMEDNFLIYIESIKIEYGKDNIYDIPSEVINNCRCLWYVNENGE